MMLISKELLTDSFSRWDLEIENAHNFIADGVVVHNSSAHIAWNGKEQKVTFFSGGTPYDEFRMLFDADGLKAKFLERFGERNVKIYGEAYGGRCQKMSHVYNDRLKFVTFEVQIDESFLDVPRAEAIVLALGLEFVYYKRVSTDLASLDAERDAESVQAIRNGCGPGHKREGVVLRTLQEFRDNSGGRVIAKHKRDDFRETKTPRAVGKDPQILLAAEAIADEWITAQRLNHVLDAVRSSTGKLDLNVEDIKTILSFMTEDIAREAAGEIVISKEALKVISTRTVLMFKQMIKDKLIEEQAAETANKAAADNNNG